MGRIVKVKNIYEFYLDGKTVPYKLDINTGVFYGLRGTAIKSAPKDITSLMSAYAQTDPLICYLRYRATNWYDKCPITGWVDHATELGLLDKLTAIGYNYNNPTDRDAIVEEYKMLAENFKALAKYLAEGNDDTPHNLRSFLRTHVREAWLTKHHMVETEQFTAPMIDWCYDHRNRFTDEQMALNAYFLPRGLWEYYHDSRSSMRDRLMELYEMAEYAECKVEKTEFFRQYINIHRNYLRVKDMRNKEEFTKAYAKYAKVLQFENDEYIVVLPQSEKDLIVEGERQGNCVGGYGKRVIDGERLVVFIRRKSAIDTPYITCDIYTGKGGWYGGRAAYINQYLARHNYSVTDYSANEFRQLFQAHLIANWVEGE